MSHTIKLIDKNKNSTKFTEFEVSDDDYNFMLLYLQQRYKFNVSGQIGSSKT
jgi:hypothetical protein